MPHVRICAGGAGQSASLPRPDRSRPLDYKRAVVVDAEKKEKKENEREKLFQVKRKKCVQKEFDRADIVRDVR